MRSSWQTARTPLQQARQQRRRAFRPAGPPSAAGMGGS